jgi:N-acetylmuramoyl-L-alanine amidase
MRLNLRYQSVKRLSQGCLLAALQLLAVCAWASDIEGLRLWRAPDHTRLVFDLTEPVEHKVMLLGDPQRLVLDIEQVGLKTGFASVDFSNSPIKGIRSGVRNKDDLRIVLDLRHTVKPRSFVLKANDKYGDRLVIDLYGKQGNKSTISTVKAASSKATQRRDIIVAIDAGHGGEDPGATGPGRIREKAVVLAIAKELESLVKRQPGYRPLMVRRGDYYIGLSKRRELARKEQADLFVSIHADAFSSPKARGSSVYALSQRGATSASAKFLAAKENEADLIGGVNLAEKDDILAEVLFDLSMTASLDASLQVGNQVLGAMGRISHLHKKRVEQAGFAVLKSPDMPSILVETGFISNPGEAKKLAQKKYQRSMARSIHTGITRYFEKNPPTGSYVAWQQRDNKTRDQHVIARGDTLSGIAQRYRVSVAALKRTNGLASSSIKIGQRLLIPAS